MASSSSVNLTNFEELREVLAAERKTLLRVNNISDESFVRTVEEATELLDFLGPIQAKLFDLFEKYPGLSEIFSKEFISASEFLSREYILDVCFLDDCLFPEKESFYFGREGALDAQALGLHTREFDLWIERAEKSHLDTQELIKDHFHDKLRSKELGCQCVQCQGDFRTRLREFLFEQCASYIEDYSQRIFERPEEGIEVISSLYREMKSLMDKAIFSKRHQLRRGTLGRLESQLKGMIREKFCYPSEIALQYAKVLGPELKHYLYEHGHELKNEGLVGQEEFEKFYSQMKTNLYRGRSYLGQEFVKFFKSLLILKRKDISSNILNTHLGEFWVHSQARLLKRRIIYHMGPTNSGKTHFSIEALCRAPTGCYLAPLRLLAAELYDKMNSKGVKTTLLTGEEVIEKEGAAHISSTIEMARLQQNFDCVVIDEIQMIQDPQRGWAWTRALVNILSPEIHVCGDHTAYDLLKKICDLCGENLEVKHYERMTKLEVEKQQINADQLQKGDALIVFSRRNALRYKNDLERMGFRTSIVYGRLSPEVRREQARKFDEGETDIIVSTDAIAMGMNLPIRRIVFSTLTKFINNKEIHITNSEIKQISGRAGRFQRFPVGFVTCLDQVESGPDRIMSATHEQLPQGEKSMVGPDLEIFLQVNNELAQNGLPILNLSEFLRLFYTMNFIAPFFCVELDEMIEVAEMVEEADRKKELSFAEIFGFACAPVNLGLLDHVQFFVFILNNYVHSRPIYFQKIDANSNDIDYLETSIKCMELYQWLARHFNNKNFEYNQSELLSNKAMAIERLNGLLSDKWVSSRSIKRRPGLRGKSPGGKRRKKLSYKRRRPYKKRRP